LHISPIHTQVEKLSLAGRRGLSSAGRTENIRISFRISVFQGECLLPIINIPSGIKNCKMMGYCHGLIGPEIRVRTIKGWMTGI
jgi:hypothetical protein